MIYRKQVEVTPEFLEYSALNDPLEYVMECLCSDIPKESILKWLIIDDKGLIVMNTTGYSNNIWQIHQDKQKKKGVYLIYLIYEIK